ncbi:MAG: ATP-binding protein [Blastocatellia bacterium]|nr:ATP-binding protein [Blastocatellia bacterium]
MDAQTPSNPFTQVKFIDDPRKFFGRQTELYQIFDRLKTLQCISVVGERRIGKPSLLYHVTQTAKQHIGEGFQAFYSDLPDVKDEESFYKLMCRALGEDGNGFSDLERIVRGKKVIACLDEFENVTKQAAFSRGFFDSLRSLAQSGNLAFILATEHSLAELCRDERIATSPFWNIFSRMDLGLFKPGEAEEMVRAGFDSAGIPLETEELARVKELAGLFPFFLQLACYHLFEMKVGRAAEWEQGFERSARDHLHYLWSKLTSRERAALRWSLGFGGRHPDDELLMDLERRGLMVPVKKQFGWWVFSEAFEVIVRNPPPRRKQKRWWNRLFSRFKGGKISVGPVSVEIPVEREEDER